MLKKLFEIFRMYHLIELLTGGWLIFAWQFAPAVVSLTVIAACCILFHHETERLLSNRCCCLLALVANDYTYG